MATTILGLVFFGGAALVFGWTAVATVRGGRPWGLQLPGDRADTPVLFWSCVGVCATLAVLAVGGGVAFAFQ